MGRRAVSRRVSRTDCLNDIGCAMSIAFGGHLMYLEDVPDHNLLSQQGQGRVNGRLPTGGRSARLPARPDGTRGLPSGVHGWAMQDACGLPQGDNASILRSYRTENPYRRCICVRQRQRIPCNSLWAEAP